MREAAASQITITIVWIAMPPIRLPAASPRFPFAAAEIVIASSGRLPAIASRITPPSASPSPKARSITSVVFASPTPATQVAAAAAAKIRARTVVESDPILSCLYLGVRLPTRGLSRRRQTEGGRRSAKRGRPSSGSSSQAGK